jgi:hypothetical protein
MAKGTVQEDTGCIVPMLDSQRQHLGATGGLVTAGEGQRAKRSGLACQIVFKLLPEFCGCGTLVNLVGECPP